MKIRKLRKKEKREVKRIVEYLVSGGAFFWSGYVVLVAMNWWLGPWYLWLSTTASYIVGWVVNYLLQRYWVFENPKLAKHQTEVTSRYLFISFVNLVLNYAIIRAWVNMGYRVELGPFIASGFFTVWNYIWYKFWVFPEKFPRRKKKRG